MSGQRYVGCSIGLGVHQPTKSTIPSATPNAHAASTLPPTYFILVKSFGIPSPLVTPSPFPSLLSNFAKYCSVSFVKLVTIFLPIRSSGVCSAPFCGTWTCKLQFPKSRSSISSTPVVSVGGVTTSCSATWSRPVIPRSTRPSPTKVGMSAAGRKTSAMGRFLTSAISSREWRWN